MERSDRQPTTRLLRAAQQGLRRYTPRNDIQAHSFMKKFVIIFLTFFLLVTRTIAFVSADETPTPSPSPTGSISGTPTPDQSQVSQLQNQINDLQSKIAGTQAQEKTLSSTIAVMDNQIKLTQLRISSTQQQIGELTANITTANTKISTLQGSLTNITKVLLQRIVATYKAGKIETAQAVLASNNLNELVERTSYLQIVQKHDKELMYDTQQAQNDYANQKQIFETEKRQVEALQSQLQQYNDQLDKQKQDKQTLLTQTQGDEASYQRQLAAAQAQLASFSSFVTSQGGASLLSGQTTCDSWGCYYNQRDSQWGSLAINGQGGFSLAEYGCLISSMAMVASHYGHNDILPSTIATSGGGR